MCVHVVVYVYCNSSSSCSRVLYLLFICIFVCVCLFVCLFFVWVRVHGGGPLFWGPVRRVKGDEGGVREIV